MNLKKKRRLLWILEIVLIVILGSIILFSIKIVPTGNVASSGTVSGGNDASSGSSTSLADSILVNISANSPKDNLKTSNQSINYNCTVTFIGVGSYAGFDLNSFVKSINLSVFSNESGQFEIINSTSKFNISFYHNLSEGDFAWFCKANASISNLFVSNQSNKKYFKILSSTRTYNAPSHSNSPQFARIPSQMISAKVSPISKGDSGLNNISQNSLYKKRLFIGSKANITSGGFKNLSLWIENTSLRGIKNFYVKEDNRIVLNLTHNFSEEPINLSEIKIILNEDSVIVDLNTSYLTKSLYLRDRGYSKICANNNKIKSEGEISFECNNPGEINFSECINNFEGIKINKTECRKIGSTYVIYNLSHSGIRGIFKENYETLLLSAQPTKNITNCTTEEWECKNFTNCTNNKKERFCYSTCGKIKKQTISCTEPTKSSSKDEIKKKGTNYLLTAIIISLIILIVIVGVLLRIVINKLKQQNSSNNESTNNNQSQIPKNQ